MRVDEPGYDHGRYRRLLAEANDEQKRMALIRLLIEESAMDRLAADSAGQRTLNAGTPARRSGASFKS
ncbi:hypothetical protein SSBR45G_03900 [Bradyrhizobium sp. SSBR45G]|uniref:hypothetical protein n=1 Tax=unclassified Bradyrhizobium TaxID=2631580 RepID=UPI00234295EE|nr:MULTISPECIES: hypothetical protein [unclassified Bradyrhizobium]GLH75482.1 hypothetical protein SSBR45G_03900 [Bradyrhizobium sp. SSBR45G]GLH82731.1 hypothetical protein SSBR45R_01910 [Bradyrhizobium sp. SSBR45R]